MLLSQTHIKNIAKDLNFTPSKKLGQNFVIDSNIIRKIIKISNIEKEDVVLEIGPGLGSLTLGLLEKAKYVIAIELDTKLVNNLYALINKFSKKYLSKLMVIHDNAVHINYLPKKPIKCVANLPYNVSVPILLNILESFSSIKNGIIMVQKEVAQRLTAKAGNKIYGVPTLKSSWYAKLSYVDSISKNVFWPTPNVESSLVFFERHKKEYPYELKDSVFRFIDIAFSQRRKTVKNAIDRWNNIYASEKIIISKDFSIDTKLRPENLTIKDFLYIVKNKHEQ